MAALVISILIVVAGVGLALFVGRRRPVGTPLTWGEAFVAGTFVFALMVVAYGVVPHQWLDYADNELLWRADKLLVGISSEGFEFGQGAKDFGGTGRVIINYQAVRDIVAAGIYIVFLGAQMYLWSIWQKRGRTKAPAEVSSRFGRPVIRKA
ncbi:MAG TPA: hypothetical protein VG078_08385 [Acidimicrobiales bacterium]|nr:hypothetical protein [Acidimicrobiales bacterium]